MAHCSNYGHCDLESPLGALGTIALYDVHLGLIGEGVVDFLLVLIELFAFLRLGCLLLSERLRAKIDRKSAISLQRGMFYPKFQAEGVAPPNQSFCTDS